MGHYSCSSRLRPPRSDENLCETDLGGAFRTAAMRYGGGPVAFTSLGRLSSLYPEIRRLSFAGTDPRPASAAFSHRSWHLSAGLPPLPDTRGPAFSSTPPSLRWQNFKSTRGHTNVKTNPTTKTQSDHQSTRNPSTNPLIYEEESVEPLPQGCSWFCAAALRLCAAPTVVAAVVAGWLSAWPAQLRAVPTTVARRPGRS